MPCQSLAVTVTLDQLSESDHMTRKLGNDSDFRRQWPPPQSGWYHTSHGDRQRLSLRLGPRGRAGGVTVRVRLSLAQSVIEPY